MIRNLLFPAAILATGAACSPNASAPDISGTPTGDNAAGYQPVTSPSQVLGEWDVVSFEGYTPTYRMQGDNRPPLPTSAKMA